MRKVINVFLMAAALCAALLALASSSVVAQEAALQVTLPGTNTPQLQPFATNTRAVLEDAEPPVTRAPSNTPAPTATFTITPSLTPSATETPSATPTTIGPLQYPEGVSSLTGLPYPSEEAFARRALIVKISNYPPVVRPQSGLNAADIVWEYEVEGGVTRFAAIFRNNAPDHVGPVRSARLLDMELVPMYQALLAYSGSSAPIQEMLLDAPWGLQIVSPSIGDNCEEAGFCRFPQEGLAFEHTLYVDTRKVWERATARGINTGYPARGFAFNETPDSGGAPALDVFIDWYGQTDARWQYDPATGRYLRYTDSAAHFDAAVNEQVWVNNLVILEVPHEERPDLFEPESRTASQQINLWDQGRAYVVRDGVFYQGYWNRPCNLQDVTATPNAQGVISDRCYSRDGTAIQLTYGNNTPIMLKPGRTWVTVTRWLNYVAVSDEVANMAATGTVIALTPTNTPWPTPVPGGGTATATPGA